MSGPRKFDACPEPDGNEVGTIAGGTLTSAHTTALREIGACPWCGADETEGGA